MKLSTEEKLRRNQIIENINFGILDVRDRFLELKEILQSFVNAPEITGIYKMYLNEISETSLEIINIINEQDRLSAASETMDSVH